jgi:alkanesulfonate monooxygenase SsuD/methylene tetrahydromethanopterin reductase-like flavin-dependent oxidoreductase (luciferase family)
MEFSACPGKRGESAVRFGLQLAPLADASLTEGCRFAAESARLSASYPFDVVVAPQHFQAMPTVYPHAMTLLASLAGETGALLATGVLPLPLLPAVEVAESAATLAAVSGGRCVLGLGLGYRRSEYTAFGVPYERRAALFEQKLRTVYATWSACDAPAAAASPGPARPPVWIGASAMAGIRRAATMADAWIAPPLVPVPHLASDLAAYRDASEAAGRPAAVPLPVRRDVFICGRGQQERQAAWQRVGSRLATYQKWGLFGPDDRPPAGQAPAVIVGTAGECRASLRGLEQTLGQPVLAILRVAWPGMRGSEVLDQIRMAGEELATSMSREQ